MNRLMDKKNITFDKMEVILKFSKKSLLTKKNHYCRLVVEILLTEIVHIFKNIKFAKLGGCI